MSKNAPEHVPSSLAAETISETKSPANAQAQAEPVVNPVFLPPGVAPLSRSDSDADAGRYEVLEQIGSGGMGTVFRARDRRLGRIVALKFIRGGDATMVMRFLQEARAQARIDNPHICKVYESGEVHGSAYIAMQFVAGKSLEQAGASLSLTQKVVILRQVAEAIHEAHRIGVIHRDLKPANIMVERLEDGSLNPIVMDFGLARETAEGHGLTQSGAIMGTPAYMAPEQARGDTRIIDRRADVYSLGATLYDLIVGTPPFDADSVVGILLQVMQDEPPPMRNRVSGLPLDLETVVMKCLNKEPNQRYDSAKALATDLGRYLDGEPVQARRLNLVQRSYRRARKHKAVVSLGAALLVAVLGLIVYGVRTQILILERARQAKQQAALAQRLGQEITKMEWLLRSARQLPLHDLGREKVIIRSRMDLLQSDLANYGELGRGLAHYALGRGHMALHEYPQALSQLQLAISLGNQSADVHYALGFVLGKHYEQAMYEARLSGGGDWANKQLMELEPKYLTPAIASLQRSRAMKLDAPAYLEGLIAYYQRDRSAALKYAETALREAPWMYEASKLAGDVHLDQALQARTSGHTEEAEREFTAAVRSFSEAATVGQSDAEVYEGLAEAWVRQIEMALSRGQPTETAYTAAVAASDKITIAEPHSIAGPLKKGFAALMTMAVTGAGMSSAERVQQCLTQTAEALQKEPGNPYASDVAADCYAFAADGAPAQGKDPEPLLRKSLSLLEPAVRQFPNFLWGLNDLSNIYRSLGAYYQLHGNSSAKEFLEKSLGYATMALNLDATYLVVLENLPVTWTMLVSTARSEPEEQSMLTRTDEVFAKCVKLNSQSQQCHINYFEFYARAAQRALLAGKDPQPRLQRALENLTLARKLGGNFLDVEQYTALAKWVEASYLVREKKDPAPALADLQAALTRCFALAASDAMCRTLAAQSEWVASDWLALHNSSPTPALKRALAKALLATQSPETYPDAWQVLAHTYLLLAQSAGNKSAARDLNLAAGLGATQKVFAINPNHALGHATKGSLLLQRAQTQRDPASRRDDATAAAAALQQALKLDSFLTYDYAALLAQAEVLSRAK